MEFKNYLHFGSRKKPHKHIENGVVVVTFYEDGKVYRLADNGVEKTTTRFEFDGKRLHETGVCVESRVGDRTTRKDYYLSSVEKTHNRPYKIVKTKMGIFDTQQEVTNYDEKGQIVSFDKTSRIEFKGKVFEEKETFDYPKNVFTVFSDPIKKSDRYTRVAMTYPIKSEHLRELKTEKYDFTQSAYESFAKMPLNNQRLGNVFGRACVVTTNCSVYAKNLEFDKEQM